MNNAFRFHLALAAIVPAFAPCAAAAPQVEEAIIGPIDQGGSFVVSPDGAHVAYAGMNGSRFYVNVDGVTGPGFDELFNVGGDIHTHPQRAGVWRSGMGDAPVLFTPDGNHHAYIGRQGGDYVVILDGKEAGRGARKALTQVGPTGLFVITHAGRHVYWAETDPNAGQSAVRLVVDNKRGPMAYGLVCPVPVFDRDENHYAYTFAKNSSSPITLVIDGKDAGYNGQNPVYTADGSALLTISYEEGKSGVLANGRLAYAGSVSKIVTAPAGSRWAAIASKLITSAGGLNLPANILVVDGKEVPGSANVQAVWFSPDGTRYAASCRNPYGKHESVMVIDGTPYEFASIDAQPPYWSADSKRLIFTARTDEGGVVVVDESMYTYQGTFNGVTVSERGNGYLWSAADIRRRNYSVVVGENPVLPAGVYPTSKLVLSPDGSRSGFHVGPVGRNETSGIVIDGAVVPGVFPGIFRGWLTDDLTTYVPLVFSADAKHVAYLGRGATDRNNSLFVDGKAVLQNASVTVFPTFSPDSQHFFWAVQDDPASMSVFVDGQQAVRANGAFFRAIPATFVVDAKGTGWFLAADGSTAKRYRITPGGSSIATMLAGGAVTADAPATPPPVAADGSGPVVATPPVPVAEKPATSAVPATEPAATAAPAEILQWADLVRRPETRPARCTLNREFRLQGGVTIPAGTTVNLLEFQPDGPVIQLLNATTALAVKAEETDVVAVANAAWATLTSRQRELTYATLMKRPDLWPYRVALLLPFEISGRKTKVGDKALFLGPDKGQMLVRIEGTGLLFDVEAQQTDLLAQARAIVESEPGAPGRLLEELSGKLVSPIDGRAVAIDLDVRPKYVVMYMGAGWCGPCQQFSPHLVKAIQEKSPTADKVAMIYVSGDRNPAEAKAYMTKLGVAWPTIYFKSRDQLPAFNTLFGNVIPQLVVTDRHGNVLIDSARLGYDRALAQLQTLL